MTSPNSQGDSDGAALAVAREFDQLRRQLGELAVHLVTVSSTVNGMAGLARQVALLSEQVTALLVRLGGGDEDGRAVTRPALPSWFEVDGEQAEQMLRDLVGWVDTILVRHAAARESLPECWIYHGEVVEDLLWLRATWMTAHRNPAAQPHHAADFHERWLPAVMARYKRQLGSGGCNFDNHHDGATEYRVRQEHHPQERIPAADPDMTDAYARWWVHTRGLTDVAPPGVLARQRQVPRTQRY